MLTISNFIAACVFYTIAVWNIECAAEFLKQRKWQEVVEARARLVSHDEEH